MKKIKATILIAEDEPAMLAGLQETFQSAGFKVLVAHDGKEAVDICLQLKPDVMLLDIIMPKMDGLTALGKIRADAWGKALPVILLTNLMPDDEITKSVVAHQPSYYLVKSDFTMSELLEKVQDTLHT